ncbi:MAG: NrfD/PsrC family molybdoenzyme membrane anchor subunit [Thermoplasmatota archaeon]|nr:polysulfide reductase NrfD [Candidatus Thermoplasmatota archaeon]
MALFLGGIGAGQFVVSTWFIHSITSALVGLLIVVIGKTVAHLVYLGRPARFYRLFMRPRTSWISRGLIFMVVFAVFAAAYLAPDIGFGWVPWTSETLMGQALWVAAVLSASLVMVYDGFVLASCKSITSWNTALMPPLFFTYAVAGGVAMTFLTMTATGGEILNRSTMTNLDAILLTTMFALVVIYMVNMASSTSTARESLRRLTTTKLAIAFVGLAIVAGLLVPLTLTYYDELAVGGTVASVLLAASSVLELAGDLSVRHSILRAGLHAPVFSEGL